MFVTFLALKSQLVLPSFLTSVQIHVSVYPQFLKCIIKLTCPSCIHHSQNPTGRLSLGHLALLDHDNLAMCWGIGTCSVVGTFRMVVDMQTQHVVRVGFPSDPGT